MLRSAVALPILTAALVTLAGCQPPPPPAPPLPALSKSLPFSSADGAFVETLNHTDLAQIAAAKVAETNAARSDLRVLAETISKDHQANRDKLASLVGPHNLTLTSDVASEDKAIAARLGKLHGQAFDRAYSAFVQRHDKTLDTAINMEIAQSKNGDLIALAKQTQSLILQHQSAAHALLPAATRRH